MVEKDEERHCSIPYYERNNYYYGKLLTVRDFHAEQKYFNEMRRLDNKSLHGWGVVCGLDLKKHPADETKIIVTPGLAIDCCGREILVHEEQEVLLKKEDLRDPVSQNGENMLICLQYHECKTEEVRIQPVACDRKDKCEHNRIRDSFRIELIPAWDIKKKPFCPKEQKEREKSLHQYLCDKLIEECPRCPDLPDSRCVILGSLLLKNDKVEGEIDTCSKRRLVYNNPLLYDLIHCYHGDLPHVTNLAWNEGTTWKDKAKDIPWDEFEKAITSGLAVTFDREMQWQTINNHTFTLAAIIAEEGTGYRQYKYIPSKEIKHIVGTKTVIFYVDDGDYEDEGWISGELNNRHSEIINGVEIEIVLKGSSIFSEEGKALDGSFNGEFPSGVGTQGSDFLSWFTVIKKES